MAAWDIFVKNVPISHNFLHQQHYKWPMSGFIFILLMAIWAVIDINFLKGHWDKVGVAYTTFSSNFSTNIIALLIIESIRVYYYALKKYLRHGFIPYTQACMASSLISSGYITTVLLNAVMYSCMEPHYCSSHKFVFSNILVI